MFLITKYPNSAEADCPCIFTQTHSIILVVVSNCQDIKLVYRVLRFLFIKRNTVYDKLGHLNLTNSLMALQILVF